MRHGFWGFLALVASTSVGHAQAGDALEVPPSATGEVRQEVPAIAPEGLPPEVERLVRFYTLGLNAERPEGGSFELALGPDSNINRTTRGDPLGGPGNDVTLGPGMTTGATAPGLPGLPGGPPPGADLYRARSGTGVVARGQAFLRRPLSNSADLLAQLAGNGNFYGDDRYDDYALSLQAGPEWLVGSDRIALLAGPSWRWYGTRPYTRALGAVASWQHVLGRRGQLRVEGGVARLDNRVDRQQDAWTLTASAFLDRQLSARSGAGLQVQAVREMARDPGFSTAGATASAYLFRNLPGVTLVATLGYGHVEADRRLFYDPRRRIDDRFETSLAATLHALRIGPLAPYVRLRWERNWSTLAIYDFKRTAGEAGLTVSF